VPINVYSTRLFAGWIGDLGTRRIVFTVPMGHRVIVASVLASQVTSSTASLELYLGSGGPILARYVPDSRNTIRAVNEHLVLHEGEQCFALVTSAGALGSIHGYLLVGSGGPLVPSQLPA
jgi:hypothetical protein